MSQTTRLIVLSMTLFGAVSGAALAAEAERPWTDTADLSLILTTGNTQTKNIAASNKFVYKWSKAEVVLFAGVLRAENTQRTVANAGGTLQTSESTATTAESYVLDGKYRRDIKEALFWFVGAGWNRNRPTGIDKHLSGGGGLGYRFFKTERNSLVGELGLDYTSEDYTSGTNASFAGARGFVGYERFISKTSKFNSDLEVLENLDDTSDLRAKWVNAVTASLSSQLALKVSHAINYDRQPVTQTLFDPTDPTGTVIEPIDFAFDKTDTVLAASLVINF